MSKARSPREVCSTTIGTSGLIGRGQSSEVDGLEPGVQISPGALCPSPSRASRASRAPAACSTGIGLALSTIRSTALRIAMSSRSASSAPWARARLSARLTCFSLGSRPGGLAQRSSTSSSDTSMPSASTIAASTASRLQRLLGVGLGLGDELLLGLAGHLRGTGCGSMPCAASRRDVRCHISCALAWTSSCGTSTSALATAASTAASRNSRLDLRAPRPRAMRCSMLARAARRASRSRRPRRRSRRPARAGASP